MNSSFFDEDVLPLTGDASPDRSSRVSCSEQSRASASLAWSGHMDYAPHYQLTRVVFQICENRRLQQIQHSSFDRPFCAERDVLLLHY